MDVERPFASLTLQNSGSPTEERRKLKVAQKVVFLFRDSDGFASALANALHSNPNSSAQRLEQPFELPLDRYGIKDQMARGLVIHFSNEGTNQVSVVLLDNYEPPTLACALSEVLDQLEGAGTTPMVIAPFLVPSTKLKLEGRSMTRKSSKIPLYCIQVGSETDISLSVAAKTQNPPPSLQIHYEPLACFFQLVNVLKLPTAILVGQCSQSAELEVLYELGEVLASATGLSFLRDKILWNPTKQSREGEEPWRALYG